LVVVRCATHRKHFTLYPPGYGPYLRKPVVDLAADGTEPLGPAGSPLHAFEGTLFDAALDAAEGKAWARDSHRAQMPPELWWSTQGRHLALTVRFLGLVAGMQASLREAIAAVLGVDLLLLHELARTVARTPGYRAKGRAILEVLGRVVSRRDRAHRLLHCAYLIGHVSLPLLWDARRRVLERLPFPFRAPERDPPPLPP
jgi:hypothetical protein